MLGVLVAVRELTTPTLERWSSGPGVQESLTTTSWMMTKTLESWWQLMDVSISPQLPRKERIRPRTLLLTVMVFVWLSLEKLYHCPPQMGKEFAMILFKIKPHVRYESWKTDRPMRKEGFNIGISKTGSGHYTVENSGHGGAGVAASWACAALATDCLVNKLGRQWWLENIKTSNHVDNRTLTR